MRFLFACFLLVLSPLGAQDPSKPLQEATDGRLKLTFEQRLRPERRIGVNFGLAPDVESPLFRTRIGAQVKATDWLRVGIMGQDARSPGFDRPVPAGFRERMDLHEAWVELFGERKQGFGAGFGRQMLNYGETRLIGVPQWVNTARTFDNARVWYRFGNARLEALMISVVPVRPQAFNRPMLEDRVWGTYNTFPEAFRGSLVEIYALRHDAPGRIGTSSFGGRLAGPTGGGLRYSLEGIAQGGHVGSLDHRAFAWFSGISRRVPLRFPLTLSVEYKYASGSDNPEVKSGTFDQLYPANHDKYGHADLMGWRNIHVVRTLNTFNIGKASLSLAYSSHWLASPRDALYTVGGRPFARVADGSAGRHVGQEVDAFVRYPVGNFNFGAGFAHFFTGEFLNKATPGVNARYGYVFQSYSF